MLGKLGASMRMAKKAKDPNEVESILKKSRFNFWQEYREAKQRKRMEQIKNDSVLQERLAQEAERDLMESEEQLSWDAYELPARNRLRMMKRHVDAQRRLKEKRVQKAKDEVRMKEEGFTYHNGVLKEFLRWRDSPALFRYYTGHKGQVYAFKMSESLDCMISASADTTLKLWDFKSGKCVRTFEGHGKAVRDCDLSPGFSIASRGGLGLAVSCSTDKTVRIWDARTGATRKEIRGHTDVVYSARFSPDGKMVCSASADCTVRLFDALEGHLTYIFHGHASAVVSVAYSPTGRYIASSSDYGERAIKLWDAASERERHVRLVAALLPVENARRGAADDARRPGGRQVLPEGRGSDLGARGPARVARRGPRARAQEAPPRAARRGGGRRRRVGRERQRQRRVHRQRRGARAPRQGGHARDGRRGRRHRHDARDRLPEHVPRGEPRADGALRVPRRRVQRRGPGALERLVRLLRDAPARPAGADGAARDAAADERAGEEPVPRRGARLTGYHVPPVRGVRGPA